SANTHLYGVHLLSQLGVPFYYGLRHNALSFDSTRFGASIALANAYASELAGRAYEVDKQFFGRRESHLVRFEVRGVYRHITHLHRTTLSRCRVRERQRRSSEEYHEVAGFVRHDGTLLGNTQRWSCRITIIRRHPPQMKCGETAVQRDFVVHR